MTLILIIVSVILVAIFTAHSCAFTNGETDEYGACAKCQLKDLANCPEKDYNTISN
jgi:hypothetical protein